MRNLVPYFDIVKYRMKKTATIYSRLSSPGLYLNPRPLE